MFITPRFVLLILLIVGAWYAVRWLNRQARRQGPAGVRRPTAPPRPRQIEAEDLVACRGCGAYVATTARACAKAGCPLPR